MSDAFRPALAAHPWMMATLSAYSGGCRTAGGRWPMGCQPSASSPVRRSAASVWPPAQIGMPPAWRGFGMMLISAIW